MINIKYPLLLDGGLSNVLKGQGYHLNHKLWHTKLLETKPEVIIQAHYDYLKAGAQCIGPEHIRSIGEILVDLEMLT